VITGDLDTALGPEAASAGTWRPPPHPSPPGTYATTAAFTLARATHTDPAGPDPAGTAARLSARLTPLDWVESTGVTGTGYLTVTVTADALATLAVRVTQAGPGCARSTILAGTHLCARRHAALETAPTWDEARRRLTDSLSGRLAEAAGAHVAWGIDAKRQPPHPPGHPGASPVAGAIALAGTEAIGYTLARIPPGAPARLDPAAAATHQLTNPAYAVRYAHARAASTLRQAADLGLGLGDAAGFRPRLLAHPGELSLLYELSWLPERVAGAARRRQPDVLARYLERLAWAYLGCQEQYPAVWPGMPATVSAAVSDTAPETVPRLWLAAAVRTALAAGLGLLGVTAPARL
jgi:arginyl-tRNA synthetase